MLSDLSVSLSGIQAPLTTLFLMILSLGLTKICLCVLVGVKDTGILYVSISFLSCSETLLGVGFPKMVCVTNLDHGLMGGGYEVTSHLASNSTFFNYFSKKN